MSKTTEAAIAAYSDHAARLMRKWDGIDIAAVYEPVRDLIPPAPCRTLDVGAGPGRDAAWLAGLGHRVTATEPVADFRDAIGRLGIADVRSAGLPGLEGIDGPFGAIVVNGVWQHLDTDDRRAAIARIVELMATGGRLILSLRHGPGHPDRPVVALDAEVEIAAAEAAGLRLLRRVERGSHQPDNVEAGVVWTWLVFEKGSA